VLNRYSLHKVNLMGSLMSISQSISDYVPFLRRFARALTGSQAAGDAYVVATLEAILGDPGQLPPGLDPRVALYRIFVKAWASLPLNHAVEPVLSGDEAAAQRNLGTLRLRPRVAFLLSSLEGFDAKQISRTLDCSVGEAQSLIDQAGREIAQQIRTDVLIIEDEPLIALDLQSLVEDLGHRVVKISPTRTRAVADAGEHRPGLILADIQLADGSSGVDAVNEILASFSVPVIFITAYPERFLTGRPPEPAFLITKPFSADVVKAVISQALFFERRSQPKDSSKDPRPAYLN
jgi:DNA-directed RNA polymerase specialized sigma24 family protein